jgi:hypothetical protein
MKLKKIKIKKNRRYIMKNLLSTLTLLTAVLFTLSSLSAQDSLKVKNQKKNQDKKLKQEQVKTETKNKGEEQAIKTKVTHGPGFVDEDGDGFNDNAPDLDGDGIPNGQDPDYDGTKARQGKGARGFIDEDGDGINDNAFDADDDGIPNGKDEDYVKPEDGTGRQIQVGKEENKGKQVKTATSLESGSTNRTGECDGTGPKGSKQKGKSR